MNPTASVLNTDQYDRRRFQELLNVSEKLMKAKEQGERHFPLFSSLMSDMWAGLFKMKPQLLDEVSPELTMNQQLMDHIMHDRHYTDFREFTRLDDFASALGASQYSETVLHWIDQQADARQDIQQARDQYQQGLDGASEAFADAVFSALSEQGHSLSQMLTQAAEQAMETKDQVQSLLGGLQAGQGAAELMKVPLGDKLLLAEKLSHDRKLREIAMWAGRMKTIARRKQRSKHSESMSRSGIRQGTDIEHLLPMELGSYASPITKMDFLRRYVEGQTLQYDTQGQEELGKGPIILCLDQSGSMMSQDSVSKGFALALMSIARKQRRDFALIPFSSSVQETLIYKGGKSTVQDMISLATTFLDGGTYFQPPLRKAMELLNQHRFQQADIIFVTDGEATDITSMFLSRWKQLQKERRFSVLTLLLGVESASEVEGFSDRIVKASSFADESIYQAFEI